MSALGTAWDPRSKRARSIGSRRWVAETATIPEDLAEFDPARVHYVETEHRTKAAAIEAALSRPDNVGCPRVREEVFELAWNLAVGEWIPVAREWTEVRR